MYVCNIDFPHNDLFSANRQCMLTQHIQWFRVGNSSQLAQENHKFVQKEVTRSVQINMKVFNVIDFNFIKTTYEWKKIVKSPAIHNILQYCIITSRQKTVGYMKVESGYAFLRTYYV